MNWFYMVSLRSQLFLARIFLYNLIPNMSKTETPTIPTTPKIQPKVLFKTTRKTQAKSMIVATSFQIRKAKEEYFKFPFVI